MKFGLTQKDRTLVINVFKAYPQREKVIIYGPRSKGNFKNGSDIDLTFIGESINLTQLNKIANDLDDLLLPYSFDLSIYAQLKQKDFLEHIDRIGQNFYVATPA